MPLQNRVTPFGEIVALPGRGLLMGNRGILHGDQRRIVRSWALKRWIACVTEFRGRQRTLMQPHRYTELFFLDESAAFSAGHRPCAECRNADFKRFRAFWQRCHGGDGKAATIDAVLHAERRSGRTKRTYRGVLSALPAGTFVTMDGAAWLIWSDALLRWSDAGYLERRDRFETLVDVLTPRSIVALFAAGLRPGVHSSAATLPDEIGR